MSELINLGDILRLPALGDRLAYFDLREADRPRPLTALELERRILAFARGLRRYGIRIGERVGILSENRLEFIVTYLGTMRMGAVAVPVNFKLAASTIAHIFRDSEIKLAFVDAQRAAAVPRGIPIVSFDEQGSGGFGEFLDPGPLETYIPGEEDLAEILYTSGSTGLPKGVPLSHQGQLWPLSHHCVELNEQTPVERTLVVAPLYHMNGLYFSTVALANRTAIFSLPRFEARTYLRAVAEYRCTVLSGIPTMFAMMVREPELIAQLDFSSVHSIAIGSAPLTDALLVQVDYTAPNWTQQVLDATGGVGVDVLLESIGGDVFEQNFECLATFGRYIIYGSTQGLGKPFEARRLMTKCQSLTGLYVPVFTARPDLVRAGLAFMVDHVVKGDLRARVAAQLPLAEAAKAHQMLEDRQVIGAIALTP